MDKSALQLNHEIRKLYQRVVHRGRLEDQVKLDTTISQYQKLIEAEQKEEDKIQAIIEELKRESIFDN